MITTIAQTFDGAIHIGSAMPAIGREFMAGDGRGVLERSGPENVIVALWGAIAHYMPRPADVLVLERPIFITRAAHDESATIVLEQRARELRLLLLQDGESLGALRRALIDPWQPAHEIGPAATTGGEA